jgi:transketolase
MNYEEKLIELALKDQKILILTSENRASIRSLPNIIPNQFIDTGINEQSLVGISAGLALRGRVPIVHGIAAFLTMRAFEFIRTDIGYPGLNIKLVGNFAGFLSTANGPTHQAIEDISLMRSVPKMNIFCPADLDDLVKGLSTIVNYNKPFYIRYNDLPPLVEHSEFALGRAEVFGEGRDIAILTYGTLFSEAYKTMKLLEANGKKVKLVNFRSLKPIDEHEIIKSIKLCKTLVTLEDHFEVGGLQSIVSEIAVRENLRVDLYSISLKNRFFKPAKFEDVLEYEGFTARQLVINIIKYLQTKQRAYNVEWSNA